jgi:hypothetical protein
MLALLAIAAHRIRGAKSFTDAELEQAHKDFRLPGVRQAFFTKPFAGYVPEREWQPLTPDSRVYETLNKTLGIDTTSMADTQFRKARYRAYVVTMHSWRHDLSRAGFHIKPEWLQGETVARKSGRFQPVARVSGRQP